MTMQELWKTMEALARGFSEITFEEFCASLEETIGAHADYARGVWPQFQNNPIAYCRSRSPIRQGRALFLMAMQKGGLGESGCEIKSIEARLSRLEKRDRAIAVQEQRLIQAALAYGRMRVLGESLDDDGHRLKHSHVDAQRYADGVLLDNLKQEARELVAVRGMTE